MRGTRGRAAALVVVAAIATFTIGTSVGGASAPAQHATAASVLGTPHKAKGSPIVLAMINDEGGALGSFPQLHEAAQDAVGYVDNFRNGVGGHPLVLDYCASTGDASASVNCANKLLSDHPVAFVGGGDFGTTGSLPVIQRAGLSYVGGASFGGLEQTSPISVQFEGFGEGVFPGLSLYAAKTLHAKNVAVIAQGTPGGAQFGTLIMTDVLKANGVSSVHEIVQDPASSDFTASIAAAVQTNPDAIVTIVTLPQCVSEIKAHQQLGVKTPLLTDAACIAPQVLQTVGAAANGVYMSLDFMPVGANNPDVKLFEAATKLYGPKNLPPDEFAQEGFASIMNIWSAFTKIGASHLTTATILRTLKAPGSHPNFMAHPYSCDRHILIAPSVCNGAVVILKIKNGVPVEVSNGFVDGSKFVARP